MSVDSSDVLDIVSDDIPDGTDLSIFVEQAETVFDEFLSGQGISEALEDLITKYLAAHYAILKYKFAKDEKAGSVSASYAVSVGKKFSSTIYGQQAILLDPTGILESMDRGGRFSPSLTWLGDNKDNYQETAGD